MSTTATVAFLLRVVVGGSNGHVALATRTGHRVCRRDHLEDEGIDSRCRSRSARSGTALMMAAVRSIRGQVRSTPSKPAVRTRGRDRIRIIAGPVVWNLCIVYNWGWLLKLEHCENPISEQQTGDQNSN